MNEDKPKTVLRYRPDITGVFPVDDHWLFTEWLRKRGTDDVIRAATYQVEWALHLREYLNARRKAAPRDPRVDDLFEQYLREREEWAHPEAICKRGNVS